VKIAFSNGDKVTTDVTGRALFVAPLNPGKISASIEGRSGRVTSTIFSLVDVPSATEEVTQAPLVASDLQAEVEIQGRHLALANAAAQFYGGQVKGSFDASLQPTPSYHADLDFSHVDVSALLAATPSLAGFSAESADGQISFDARGSTRADLLDSLICQGEARFEGPELQNVRFTGPASGSSALGSVLRFLSGSAKFSCSQRTIQFQQLLLQRTDGTAEGSGTIDFSRNVDVRLEMITAAPASGSPAAPTMHLGGTLPALQAARISTAATRRAR
jgi:hypothetical protein